MVRAGVMKAFRGVVQFGTQSSLQLIRVTGHKRLEIEFHSLVTLYATQGILGLMLAMQPVRHRDAHTAHMQAMPQ